MPFCGRPSDACAPCRKGKLRCDKIRPSCTQCLRKSRSCFGYRDVPLLLFRDESDSTAQKVQLRKSRTAYAWNIQNPSSESRSQTPLANEGSSFNSAQPTLHPVVALPRAELALGYFMSCYVQSSSFDYLPEIYNLATASTDVVLSPAILAVAYASLSLSLTSSELASYGRYHYSKALLLTNIALSSLDTAAVDSSLISVLLLGLYEALTFSAKDSPTSWTSHTLGAIELIRLRGPNQLSTELGTRLFVQVSNNIRTSCIQRNVAIPDGFVQLCREYRPLLDPNYPNHRLAPHLDKVANLKARLLEHLNWEELPGIVLEALALDLETKVLMAMVPKSWSYQVLPPYLTPSCAFQGLAHRYQDGRTARHWNTLRMTRILLNEIVLRIAKGLAHCQSYGDPDYGELQEKAATNRNQLCIDILASAPQFLDESSMSFTIAARFLIWPLTIVARLSETMPTVQQCAIKYLCDIADQGRVPHAMQAAKAVQVEGPDDWMHLYLLG